MILSFQDGAKQGTFLLSAYDFCVDCAHGKRFCFGWHPFEHDEHLWSQKVSDREIFMTIERGFAVDDTHLSMTSVCGHKKYRIGRYLGPWKEVLLWTVPI